MAIPVRGIGTQSSTKEQLLWNISKQLDILTKTAGNVIVTPTPANSCDTSNLNIETLLTNMNSCYEQVTSLFPTITYFTDDSQGEGNTSISNGCSDMWDGGNLFNTNLTQTYNAAKQDNVDFNLSIPYTHTQDTEGYSCDYTNPPMDGQIVSGTGIFNSASTTCSKYFTNMYPGMFMIAATGVNVAQFGIYGNLGSDGEAINYTYSDITNYPNWTVFLKVNDDSQGTGDPTLTNIMLVYGNIDNVAQVIDCYGQYDDNVLVGLSEVNTAIITIVFATESGQANVTIEDAVAIGDQILDVYTNGCVPPTTTTTTTGEPTTTTTTTAVPTPFLMTLNVVNPGTTVTLPYGGSAAYTGTIDWGDATVTANSFATKQHTYLTPGVYQITIDGTVGFWNAGYYSAPMNELVSIDQFGNQFSFGNNEGTYFAGLSGLVTIASDIPLTGITSMYAMFSTCSRFNQDISGWDVSAVTEMTGMFANATDFNQNLSGWCVTNIPTEPGNFANNATSWVLPKPVWGTCP